MYDMPAAMRKMNPTKSCPIMLKWCGHCDSSACTPVPIWSGAPYRAREVEKAPLQIQLSSQKKKEIASSVGGGPRGLESPMQKPNVASSGPDARSVSARRELSSLPAKGKR
jgi:hypothetical protein